MALHPTTWPTLTTGLIGLSPGAPANSGALWWHSHSLPSIYVFWHRKFLIYRHPDSIGIIWLPGDTSLHELKNEICKRTNIHPSLQTIRELSNERKIGTAISGDSETLLDRKRVLHLSMNDNLEADNDQSYNIAAAMLERPEVMEMLEEDACINFIEKFHSQYGSVHDSFLDCSLNDAIDHLINSPVELRRPIALYFHNEDDPFSNIFCPTLVDGVIHDIIAKSFDVLGWDLVSNCNGALETAIREWPQLRVTEKWVHEKRSALVILYPTTDSFAIFSMWQGNNVLVRDIYTVLKDIESNLQHDIVTISTNEVESENGIGVSEYQQIMYERLGDRDYDSFESDEHEHLKRVIKFAKFGPPQSDNGYNEQQNKQMKETYECIRKQNNLYAEWQDHVVISCIYNCLEPLESEKLKRKQKDPDYNAYTDVMPVPIFVIQKCLGSKNPCRIFIDNNNRVYKSWKDYLKNNKLHKCMMVLPVNGRYVADEFGKVALVMYRSPACNVGHTIQKTTDTVNAVAAITAGGVFALAAIPAIAIAPIALIAATITGVGVGTYSIVRSSIAIADRANHKEDMSIGNSEARGAYLNLVAGSLSFIGAGATSIVSNLAAQGVKIGLGGKAALDAVNIVNLGAGATSVANSSYEIISCWTDDSRNISPLSILQFTSNLLFFSHAAITFKTANTIVTESQTNSINNIKGSLKSYRQRRMFNKMEKASMQRNNGNVQRARAEVISSLINVPKNAEVLAILERTNERFDKDKVEFSAVNGKITLNGVVVGKILSLGVSAMVETSIQLIDLPPSPKLNPKEFQHNVTDVSTIFKSVFSVEYLSKIFSFGKMLINGEITFMEVATQFLLVFSKVIREKIVRILATLLRKSEVMNTLEVVCTKVFPNNNPRIIGLEFVIKFLKLKMNAYEEEFRRTHCGGEIPSPVINCAKRAMYLFEKVLNVFVRGFSISEALLEELINYVMTQFAEILCLHDLKMYALEKIRNRSKRQLSKRKIACKVCNGCYYSFNG